MSHYFAKGLHYFIACHLKVKLSPFHSLYKNVLGSEGRSWLVGILFVNGRHIPINSGNYPYLEFGD